MKKLKAMQKVLLLAVCLLLIGAYWSANALANWWVGRPVAAEERTKAVRAQQVVSKLETVWKQTLTADPPDSDVDIAVYDSLTGGTAHYTVAKPNDSFITASVIKLPILETILLQNQRKGISGLTSSQLAEARPMIENSDNDAATVMWDEAGKTAALNAFFKQIGANDSQAAAEHWGLSTTTAPDQLKVINQIAYPKLLLSNSASTVNTLLGRVESDQRWGVSAGVPGGASVLLKDGWLEPAESNGDGWVVNSVGHVSGDGADYTIAVLTDSDTTEQQGIATIEALSTATWQVLNAAGR